MLVRHLAPVVFLSTVVVSGCRFDVMLANAQILGAASEASSLETTQTLVSSDGQTQVTLPKAWSSTLDASDSATIEATQDNMYVTVQTERKADFQGFFSLQEFADFSRDVGAAMINNPQVSGLSEVTIHGNRALQYEVRGDFGGLQMVQLHTTVETPKNYHHILVAASRTEFEQDQASLEAIVQSFQELPVDSSVE